jgi:hypothetical protein
MLTCGKAVIQNNGNDPGMMVVLDPARSENALLVRLPDKFLYLLNRFTQC